MKNNTFSIQKNTMRDLTGNEVAQVAGATGAPPSTFPNTDPTITSTGPTLTTYTTLTTGGQTTTYTTNEPTTTTFIE